MGRTLMALLLMGCLAAVALAADSKHASTTAEATKATEVSASKRFDSEHLPSMKENWISGKDDETKITLPETGKDIPPEVAVKKATRLLEEEVERRKKFRSMMRSLVQSDLPHLDPKLEFIQEEVKEPPSKVVQKLAEEANHFQSPFAHIFPFMFPLPFLPSPFGSSFSRPNSEVEESSESENTRMVFIESFPPPPEEKNTYKKLETSVKNPMMVLMPQRTLRLDMTFIPIRSELSKEKSIVNRGFEVPPETSNSHSVRVFSSGTSPNHDSPYFTPLDSLPFSRLFNFFRNAEEEVEKSAKMEKPLTTTQTTRHKREATTTLSPLNDEPLEAMEESSPVPESSRTIPPARNEEAREAQEEDAPTSRLLETARAKEPRKKSESSSRNDLGPLSYRVDPSFFHPHPMTAFLYPHMDPYFHFLPYYINPGHMFPNKMALSAMLGVVPSLAGSPLEQQMVAMNQLSHEAASVDAANGPCVGAPCPPAMRSVAKDNRQRRSIAYDTPFANNALFQRQTPRFPFNSGEPGPSRKSATETEQQEYLADENTPEEDPALIESKLSFTGEPEAIRRLNPHFKMSFGSEDSLNNDERRPDDASELPVVSKGNEKLKPSPYSWKKSFQMKPEKKLSKKKLAGMGTMPSHENEDPERNPLPHPWRVPALGMNPFSGRMLPSLLAESERPVDEGMPYRGKRSLSHVQFLHPYIDAEDQGHLKAVQDDLLLGEGTDDMYLSAVAGSKRRKNKASKIVTIHIKGKNEDGQVVEESIKFPVFGKEKVNFTPWLDPTMLGDDHDEHMHRQDFSNDIKFSSYDH